MTHSVSPAASPNDDSSAIALIIRVCGEALAIPVSHVHEVIDPIPRTRVPRASSFAPWLINVRGAVVPLVDVRERLRMPVSSENQGRIVVLDIAVGAETYRLAMLADDVQEVVDIDPAAIEDLPENGSPWPANYVTGALRRGDDLILLLDPENLFRPEQAA